MPELGVVAPALCEDLTLLTDDGQDVYASGVSVQTGDTVGVRTEDGDAGEFC